MTIQAIGQTNVNELRARATEADGSQKDVVSVGKESGVINDITKSVRNYFKNVSENIKENGIAGTLMSGAGEGFCGGLAGCLAGAFVGCFLPPQLQPISQSLPAVGAIGGFLHGIAE